VPNAIADIDPHMIDLLAGTSVTRTGPTRAAWTTIHPFATTATARARRAP
jgi:hypothetical protein